MSGHSKWSTIKHKKGAADAKRGKLFSKLSRSIMVAAKEGGADPATNMALANAIEKARSYSMPKDNIDRAIAKGSGEGADGAVFESVVYEGYGPEGVAVIVEALTDNRNRTAADVRHLFTKHGGNLGTTGAVAWQFERRGIVLVPSDGVDEEALFLAVADAGADDVEQDGSVFQVSSTPEQLQAVRHAVEEAGFAVESAELSMVPKVTVAIDDDSTAKKVVRLVEALEDNDDVQDVYANFDIPEAVLEAAVSYARSPVSRIVRADEGQIVSPADDAKLARRTVDLHEQPRLHPPTAVTRRAPGRPHRRVRGRRRHPLPRHRRRPRPGATRSRSRGRARRTAATGARSRSTTSTATDRRPSAEAPTLPS